MKLATANAVNYRVHLDNVTLLRKMDRIFYRLCRDPRDFTHEGRHHLNEKCPICGNNPGWHDFHFKYRLRYKGH